MPYVGNKKKHYQGLSRTGKCSRTRKKMKDGLEVREDEIALLPQMERDWVRKGGGLKGGGIAHWKAKYLTPRERRERGMEPVLPGVMGNHEVANRTRDALGAFKARFEPVFQRYETQIADNPDLSDKETMAASWIALIRDATTLNVAERSLAQLQKVFGHDEKKVTITDGRSPERVMADVGERLRRLMDHEVVDLTPKLEEG